MRPVIKHAATTKAVENNRKSWREKLWEQY